MFTFLIFIIAAVLVYFMYHSFSLANKNTAKYYARNLLLLAGSAIVSCIGMLLADSYFNLADWLILLCGFAGWLCMFKEAYYWCNDRAAAKIFYTPIAVDTVCYVYENGAYYSQKLCKAVSNGKEFVLTFNDDDRRLWSGMQLTKAVLRRNLIECAFVGDESTYTAKKLYNIKTRQMTLAAIEGSTTVAASIQF